jgi:hypothetical protein
MLRQLSQGCESAAQGTDLDTGIEILEEELSTNPLNGEWSSVPLPCLPCSLPAADTQIGTDFGARRPWSK